MNYQELVSYCGKYGFAVDKYKRDITIYYTQQTYQEYTRGRVAYRGSLAGAEAWMNGFVEAFDFTAELLSMKRQYYANMAELYMSEVVKWLGIFVDKGRKEDYYHELQKAQFHFRKYQSAIMQYLLHTKSLSSLTYGESDGIEETTELWRSMGIEQYDCMLGMTDYFTPPYLLEPYGKQWSDDWEGVIQRIDERIASHAQSELIQAEMARLDRELAVKQ